jgi:hypothetical protein
VEYRSQGFLQYTTECLEGLAWVANAGERHRDAAVLLGAASSYRERTKTPKWGLMSEEFDVQAAIARAALGEAAFETAWAAGRSQPDAAIDIGLDVCGGRPGRLRAM